MSSTCDGCDIVQSDHAPEAGVAQGIFHGDLIRHQGRHQVELEEELEEEVERRAKREHSSNQTQVRMHGHGMTHRARLEPQVRCINTCASTDGARRAQNCAMFAPVCIVVFMQLFAMCSRLFKLCVRMYAVCRSHLCIVDVREYEVQDTFPLHPPRR